MRVNAEELAALASTVLRGEGLDPDAVTAVTDALVWADRRGRGPQGTIWLEALVQRCRGGGTDPSARPEVVEDQGARVVLDARRGIGHVAGRVAVEIALDRVEQYGAGIVAVRDSSHFGACGHYATLIAEAGHLGVAATNAYPKVAPHGARTAVLGTNPMAFAVPRADGPVIVADLSTGATAGSKVRDARLSGARLPPEVALDADGLPTTDPNALDQGGVMLPMGGPKGSALGLLVELLTSVLASGAPPSRLGSMFDTRTPAGTSHVVMAFALTAGASEAVASLAGDILGATPRPDMTVRLPGDAGSAAETNDPILDAATVDALRRVAADAGLAVPEWLR